MRHDAVEEHFVEHGPSYPGLLKAIEAAGGTQMALANVLGVSQAAVHKMLQSRQPLAPKHCTTIEKQLRIPRYFMRPTDYWTIWPDLPEPDDAVGTAD